MNTICQRILVLGAILIFSLPAARSERPAKDTRPTQEDRIKKLEERTDAAEKAASSAAMEKDYITRVQKQYESYYQKVLNTQIWTLGIMGLILTGVFVLVSRFSLKMIDEQTKTAMAGATVQMRNEYARAIAKEVQKLWDSNAADIKKLKETLTTEIAEREQNMKAKSDYQFAFVQGLTLAVDNRGGDSVVSFCEALRSYKSGKSRNLMETKVGATTVLHICESLRKMHGENYLENVRQELVDPLYNGLEEELALAALEIPWLTPLINERKPAPLEPVVPEPVRERNSVAAMSEVAPAEPDLTVGEESDSCRLLTS